MQGEEQLPQGRLLGCFRQRGPVPRGGMRMPAMPVAQMPGASQAGLARMALLAVELAAKADARLVPAGIAAGCGTDAPGSYIAWLCTQVPVYAMEMPGRRYDIGNLESYHKVCEEYKGITE